MIIPSLICEFDIKEVDGNMWNPLFEKKVSGQKRSREMN